MRNDIPARTGLNKTPRPRFRLLPLAAAVTLCLSATSHAATIAVNDASGDSVLGKCTLADAVAALNTAIAVNACAAGDGNNDTVDLSFFTSPTQISFALANSTDSQSAIEFIKPAKLSGPIGDAGPLVEIVRSSVSGTYFRVIAVSSNVTISGVTVSHGLANGRGAGIYAKGTANLTLSHVVIKDNAQATQPYSGGGVAASHGSITIGNSTISGNSSTNYGGGVYTSYDGTVTLTNSTVSGNTAYRGGGVFDFSGSVTATGSTISNNTATSHGGNDGGGIYAFQNATLTNSTVTGNSALYFGGGVESYHNVYLYFSTITGNSASVNGAGVQVGYLNTKLVSIGSIIRGNNGADLYVPNSNFSFTGSNNIIGSPPASAPVDTRDCDPKLEQLADNGGPTQTMGLLTGSCAIDAGSATAVNGVTTDQRGLPRPVGAATDIGAFEKQGPKDPPDVIFVNGFDT